MKTPSEKAQALADELVDYVHPGMTRAAAAREIATMIDDSNEELLAAVFHLLQDAERFGSGPCSSAIQEVRTAARSYLPVPKLTEMDHHDLFGAKTPIQASLFAGEMP